MTPEQAAVIEAAKKLNELKSPSVSRILEHDKRTHEAKLVRALEMAVEALLGAEAVRKG